LPPDCYCGCLAAISARGRDHPNAHELHAIHSRKISLRFYDILWRERRNALKEGAGAMDEQAYQYWQRLHQRVVMGETLSAAEQAVYEAGCEQLDAEERLDGNLERLRALRAQIVAAEAEQQRLRAHEAELDARIAALEARLDTRTRQLLGIGN
jgi:chromosome segregation ATPase